jgi:hypothetical protein
LLHEFVDPTKKTRVNWASRLPIRTQRGVVDVVCVDDARVVTLPRPALGCEQRANRAFARKKRMIAEPTFIASLNGLCGFILVVEDGEVDAYAPSGELLGVFHDRIAAVEAVLVRGVKIGPLNH